MSSEGKIPVKLSSDNNSGGRKTGYLRPQEHGIRCPRCDSTNTKFCYYNNYSLSQPRYFCKTCRRYWTKGGALRNVPIGGGCRKNKKIKPNSLGLSYDSSNSPSLEFHQLGAIQNVGAITTTTSTSATTNPSSFDIHTSVGSNSLMGLGYFGYPSIIGGSFSGGIPGMMGSLGLNTSLASSIESLSCINQDLHWKLQQEGLGFVLGEEKLKDCSGLFENQVQKPEPICFQNLEMSKQEAHGVVASLRKSGVGGNVTTSDQWVFDNSYSPPSNNNCSVNGNGNISNWTGIQGWTDLHQYSGLPQ